MLENQGKSKENLWKIPCANGSNIIWRKIKLHTQLLQLQKESLKKKVRLVRASNPWSLRYRCSALPIKLTSQLGTGSNRLLELVVELVCYKPVKGWWCEYNCDDLPSNDSSLRKKKKNPTKGCTQKKETELLHRPSARIKILASQNHPPPSLF